MDQEDLVDLIGSVVDQLGDFIASPELNAFPASLQQVIALQKHLADQQRDLVRATIQEDDVNFKMQTGLIEAATKQLQADIDQIDTIDSVINTIATISASLDSIVKAV